MLKSENLYSEIKNAIKTISSKNEKDRADVLNIFNTIQKEFNSLTETDFVDTTHYNIYLRAKFMFNQTQSLNLEAKYLGDATDTLHISDNYFQTKTTLISISIPLQKRGYFQDF